MANKKQSAAPVAALQPKEEAAPEAPEQVKSEQVSIEMSKEQAEKFAQFLVKEETAVQKNEPKATALIELRFQHRRNRKLYGPGFAQCDEDLAGSLMAADIKALEMRLRENQSDGGLFEIAMNGQTRRIK